MEDRYTKVLYEAVWAFTHPVLPKVRAVSANWDEDILHLTVYHQGELTEDEAWDISEATGHTIANFWGTVLEEKFVRWDEPKPLPHEEYWVYPPPKAWTEGLTEKQAQLSQRVQDTMKNRNIPGLRAISVEWSAVGQILLFFYFYGSPNENQDEQIAQNLSEEIMLPFERKEPQNYTAITAHPQNVLPKSQYFAWTAAAEQGL